MKNAENASWTQIESSAYENRVKLDCRSYVKITMTNLTLTVGEAEGLNKWKSGICHSISESIRELENLVVDEAKKVVMENQMCSSTSC